MLTISIITLFPDFIEQLNHYSIVRQAILKKKLQLHIINLRAYGIGHGQQVDDYQYGGGGGMVLISTVVINAIEMTKKKYGGRVIMLTPKGQLLTQPSLNKILLAKPTALILLCGHYEGFDQRIYQYVDAQISIGDYVLSGGEIPAMVLVDAIARQLPGVINAQSLLHESFDDYHQQQLLLDYPVYTRPLFFRYQAIPPVLLSGDHQAITC